MIENEEFEKKEEPQGVEIASQKTHMKYLISPWYKEIVEYLLTLSCPPCCDNTKYITLKLRS